MNKDFGPDYEINNEQDDCGEPVTTGEIIIALSFAVVLFGLIMWWVI